MGRTTRPRVPIDTNGPSRAPARTGAILAALALLSLACGDSSGDSPQTAPVGVDREVDDVTPAPILAEQSVEDGPVTTDTLVPPTPTDPPPAGRPTIGDLDIPCGQPGEGSDVGIDEQNIVIGVGNDRGGLHASGSGRGVVEAVRALADHCNAHGGIAGRQIVVEELDAAVVEVEDRMTEACSVVFALVGHAYLADDVGEAARLECGLPAFPAWSTGVADDADLQVSALPGTPLPVPLHGNLAALIGAPADGTRIAFVGPETKGGATVRALRLYALAASGIPFEILADVGYAVDAAPDWPAIVEVIRQAGAGVVDLDGSCRTALVPFLRAAAEVGWNPAVIAGPAAYDDSCVSEATDVSFARVLVEVPFLPVSDGDAAPATAATAEIFAELGVPLTGDSLRAASAFWLWATAAEACGSELDRGCVIERAVADEYWTAGGLHAPSNPGTSAMEPCAVLLGVDDGVLVRRLPVEPGGYDCEPLA